MLALTILTTAIISLMYYTNQYSYNQMEALQWCREQGYAWNEEACTAAAVGGHCSMVQYLHEQGTHTQYTYFTVWAYTHSSCSR
jgi:hypothetical protein